MVMRMESNDKRNYSDIGAVTPEARSISMKSRCLIAEVIGNETLEDRVRQRCVIATGDLDIKDILKFKCDPINAGLRALENCARIYADIRMVEVGIVKKGHRSEVVSFIGKGDDLAKELGITRTSAGVLAQKDALTGSIVVVGNAPSALITLCEMIEKEKVMPELVIGASVGFVNAAESKEMLRDLDVPSISTVGTRGGTPIAVAAMNEIINIYYEKSNL
jgi:precorrin-8X/cobalt-precorrin-8 methylmutase